MIWARTDFHLLELHCHHCNYTAPIHNISTGYVNQWKCYPHTLYPKNSGKCCHFFFYSFFFSTTCILESVGLRLKVLKRLLILINLNQNHHLINLFITLLSPTFLYFITTAYVSHSMWRNDLLDWGLRSQSALLVARLFMSQQHQTLHNSKSIYSIHIMTWNLKGYWPAVRLTVHLSP